jgi:tRNA threonylcarbamoyladenosine biosynthesis protein TsaB
VRVLGIESSSYRSGVAVVGAEGLIAESTFEHDQGLLVRLAPAIRELVCDGDAGSVDGIAVSGGPGSFTGLRIGVATAKTLAYAWRVPVVCVPTMEALLHTVLAVVDDPGYAVALMIRSRRGEVFGAAYEQGAAGPIALLDARCAAVDDFLSEVARIETPGVVIVGDAADLYRESVVRAMPRAAFVGKDADCPSALQVARIGRERLVRGESDDAVALAPRYYRRTYVDTE